MGHNILGTQSNLCALMSTCWERGTEIFVGDKSHIALYEQGNVSQFGGILVRTVPNNDDGSFDLDYLETLLHTGGPDLFLPHNCITGVAYQNGPEHFFP